ncbi:uncharacterized protein LOC144875258 [Branchiostoma floridae x Branchiostoma japonicum]
MKRQSFPLLLDLLYRPVCEDVLQAECGLESTATLNDLKCYEITSQFTPCRDDDSFEVFHDSEACDGRMDCSTGKDEANCEGCAMECLTGLDDPCIPHGWICDDIEDCLDGKDEQRCLYGVSKDCFFSCFNNVTCLPTLGLGDGHRDCTFGEDETPNYIEESLRDHWGSCSYNCTSVYGNALSVPDAFRCDGDADCLEGEDEQICSGDTAEQSHEGTEDDCPTITCFLHGVPDFSCLPNHLVCDGHPDCVLQEDEQGCGDNPEQILDQEPTVGPTDGPKPTERPTDPFETSEETTAGQEPSEETIGGQEPTYDHEAAAEPTSLEERKVTDFYARSHGHKNRAVFWIAVGELVAHVFFDNAL